MKNKNSRHTIVKGQSIWFCSSKFDTIYIHTHTRYTIVVVSQSYFYARPTFVIVEGDTHTKQFLPLIFIFGVIFVRKTSFFPLFFLSFSVYPFGIFKIVNFNNALLQQQHRHIGTVYALDTIIRHIHTHTHTHLYIFFQFPFVLFHFRFRFHFHFRYISLKYLFNAFIGTYTCSHSRCVIEPIVDA